MNEHLRVKSQPQHGLAVQELTDQQVRERYTQELHKLQLLNQHGRHSAHFQGYPNTSILKQCKRELERRRLPVPPINEPNTDEGDHHHA